MTNYISLCGCESSGLLSTASINHSLCYLLLLNLPLGVELLASSSKDCEIRIWDPTTASCLAVGAGHVAAVTAVAWSKSKSKGGKYLASGGADKLLKLWDTSKVLAAAVAAAAQTETGVLGC